MSKPAARGGSEPVILLGLRSPPVRDVPDGFAERSIGLYPGLFHKIRYCEATVAPSGSGCGSP